MFYRPLIGDLIMGAETSLRKKESEVVDDDERKSPSFSLSLMETSRLPNTSQAFLKPYEISVPAYYLRSKQRKTIMEPIRLPTFSNARCNSSENELI